MVAVPATHLKTATEIPDRFTINEVPVEPGIAPLAATQPPPPLGPEGSTGTPAGAGQTRSGGGDRTSSGPGGGER